jgi:DNA helicase-2/ATP-dependent DNA helicase PcrA
VHDICLADPPLGGTRIYQVLGPESVMQGAVRCLTIAASKGLEFRHVFLMGLVKDELPSSHSRKKGDVGDEMREERRNCFVAITRAEETLTLTYAGKYFGWTKEPSRFLREMGAPLE